MNKTLTAILQPLVEMVPEFKDKDDLARWIRDCFPCGSKSVAAIASLGKWLQSKKNGDRSSAFLSSGWQDWTLGTDRDECALCGEAYNTCYKCHLSKFGGMCGLGDRNPFNLATRKGNKQPLIDALELASIYALVDELRAKCEATIEDVMK